MLRAFVVLPVYLACVYFAPQSPVYQRFHALVAASEDYIQYHLIGYGAGLTGAALLALLLHFNWDPRTYVQGVLHAVLRMGLIGIVLTCGWQLYQFFTGGELSVFMLLIPFIFMVAELIYEFVEFALAQIRKAFGRIQGA